MFILKDELYYLSKNFIILTGKIDWKIDSIFGNALFITMPLIVKICSNLADSQRQLLSNLALIELELILTTCKM